MIKLAVGIRDVAHLEAIQRARAEARGDLSARRAYTRRQPVRPEVLNGSLYWVIQGTIRCRQKLRAFETDYDAEGKPYCSIVLDPEPIATVPTPRRPFQGWRYLTSEAAPGDLASYGGGEPPSETMLAELRELGLL